MIKYFLIVWCTLYVNGMLCQAICNYDLVEGSQEYFYKTDMLPDQYDLGLPGEDNIWLFTSLQAPRSQRYVLTQASEGKYYSYFEGSEYVYLEPNGKETYIARVLGSSESEQANSSPWRELGFALPQDGSLEPLIRKYDSSIKACYLSGDENSDYGFKIENLSIEATINERRDASGILYLPDGIHEVIRRRRVTTFNQDGNQKLTKEFLFDDVIMGNLVMVVTMDKDDKISKIRYLSNEDTYVRRPVNSKNQFLLYPNTGYGNVRLEFSNFQPGNYSFIVYDIIGREMQRSEFIIEGDITVKQDLSFLPRGTYPYTIMDQDQNRILTRRLVIIKS